MFITLFNDKVREALAWDGERKKSCGFRSYTSRWFRSKPITIICLLETDYETVFVSLLEGFMTIKLKHIPLLNIDLFYWLHAAFGVAEEVMQETATDLGFERTSAMTFHTSNLTIDLQAPRSFIRF